jgi:hypothetical protein
MDRRGFIRATGVAVASPVAGNLFSSSANAAAPRPALMKVGTQHGDSDAILRALAGFGVNHTCSRLPSEKLDDKWSVDALSKRPYQMKSTPQDRRPQLPPCVRPGAGREFAPERLFIRSLSSGVPTLDP